MMGSAVTTAHRAPSDTARSKIDTRVQSTPRSHVESARALTDAAEQCSQQRGDAHTLVDSSAQSTRPCAMSGCMPRVQTSMNAPSMPVPSCGSMSSARDVESDADATEQSSQQRNDAHVLVDSSAQSTRPCAIAGCLPLVQMIMGTPTTSLPSHDTADNARDVKSDVDAAERCSQTCAMLACASVHEIAQPSRTDVFLAYMLLLQTSQSTRWVPAVRLYSCV
jgi:hypothetical protein